MCRCVLLLLSQEAARCCAGGRGVAPRFLCAFSVPLNTPRGAHFLTSNLGWGRASQRSESRRRAVVVVRVWRALLRGSSMINGRSSIKLDHKRENAVRARKRDQVKYTTLYGRWMGSFSG